MILAAESVRQIVAACWVVGLSAIAVGFFAWVFSGGLFAPAKSLEPQGLAFWLFGLAAFVALGSVSVGSGSCWLATWQLSESVCSFGTMVRGPSTPEARRSAGLLAFSIFFIGSLFGLLVLLLVLLSGTHGQIGRFARRVLRSKQVHRRHNDG